MHFDVFPGFRPFLNACSRKDADYSRRARSVWKFTMTHSFYPAYGINSNNPLHTPRRSRIPSLYPTFHCQTASASIGELHVHKVFQICRPDIVLCSHWKFLLFSLPSASIIVTGSSLVDTSTASSSFESQTLTLYTHHSLPPASRSHPHGISGKRRMFPERPPCG